MYTLNKTQVAILLSTLSFSLIGCAGTKKMDKMAMKDGIKPKKASSFPDTVKSPVPGEIIVKCAGIAKKGKNHCGAN